MAQTLEGILSYPSMDAGEAKEALNRAVAIVKENLGTFTDHFQSSNSFNGFYQPTENVEWTTGFWTGVIWLAYEATGNENFRKAAEIQVESFLERIQKKIDVNHHDMGFLFSLSCVAAYKLTGNEHGKKAALLAADHLAERYREKGKFLQAWGNVGEPREYRLIIDCLLNLPLLYWASEVTGEPRYGQMAENHIRTAMKCILRPDHSTYHTHFIDIETGEPTYGVTHQGNRNGSAWARGQAWGVYGIALSYRYLKEASYIDLFCKVTDYFLCHLPEDLIPYWDFDFDTGSTEPRDSSAAAIAVCGMLEMAKYLDEERAAYYRQAACRMLRALIDQCGNRDIRQSNGLLLHGTYARDSKENTCANRGVDECNTWGDYFYMEALTRMVKDWKLYW
ncbi:MAG: glycoside hydrolase family 88 protein [Lachnospiraceae bacterium]|nr:glycoside hydrolase family 88 protein [Lachnospiraceae bacterium]